MTARAATKPLARLNELSALEITRAIGGGTHDVRSGDARVPRAHRGARAQGARLGIPRSGAGDRAGARAGPQRVLGPAHRRAVRRERHHRYLRHAHRRTARRSTPGIARGATPRALQWDARRAAWSWARRSPRNSRSTIRARRAIPSIPARTPGGSSSGSAAAVADCMVPLALGTQTTGSTIKPGSFCGVFAYRPTFGDVRCSGVMESSGSCDTVGFYARTVEDIALHRDVLVGADPVAASGRCAGAAHRVRPPAAVAPARARTRRSCSKMRRAGSRAPARR